MVGKSGGARSVRPHTANKLLVRLLAKGDFVMQILLGVFFVLHGLVHLLYFGQSQRAFELQPGMVWPDGSFVLAKLLGNEPARLAAGVSLVLAAVGFLVGGIGLFVKQGWWRGLIVGTAVFSTLLYLLFWDGKIQELDDKGGVGILINLAILTALLLFQWPEFEF